MHLQMKKFNTANQVKVLTQMKIIMCRQKKTLIMYVKLKGSIADYVNFRRDKFDMENPIEAVCTHDEMIDTGQTKGLEFNGISKVACIQLTVPIAGHRTEIIEMVYRMSVGYVMKDAKLKNEVIEDVLGNLVYSTLINHGSQLFGNLVLLLELQGNMKNMKKSSQEYYQEKYSCAMCDPKQSLMVSRPKDSNMMGRLTVPISLFPELCLLTGITDMQRSDFRLISSLSQWTCVEHNKLGQSLVQLFNWLTKVPSGNQELLPCNMMFSPKLLEMKGRLPIPEMVILKTKVNYSTSIVTREVQRGLFNPANITKW